MRQNISNITLTPSTRQNKKWRVSFVLNNKPYNVDFGDNRYEDYTTHKDKARRESYRARHNNRHIKDVLSPAFWSWYLLWGPYTDIKKNLSFVVNAVV